MPSVGVRVLLLFDPVDPVVGEALLLGFFELRRDVFDAKVVGFFELRGDAFDAKVVGVAMCLIWQGWRGKFCTINFTCYPCRDAVAAGIIVCHFAVLFMFGIDSATRLDGSPAASGVGWEW